LSFPNREKEDTPSTGDLEPDAQGILLGLAQAEEILYGGTFSAELDHTDARFGKGNIDCFRVRLTEGQNVLITVESSAIDPVAYLAPLDIIKNPSLGSWEDDDSGPGLNAQIQCTVPRADIYILIVSSYHGAQGAYQIHFGDIESQISTAKNEGWSFLARGDGNDLLVDFGSHTRLSAYHHIVELKVKYDQEYWDSDLGGYIDEVLLTCELNCKSQSLVLSQAVLYHDGTLITSYDRSYGVRKMQFFEPGGFASELEATLCP